MLVLHNMFIFYYASARLPRQNIFVMLFHLLLGYYSSAASNIIFGGNLYVLMNTQIQIYIYPSLPPQEQYLSNKL